MYPACELSRKSIVPHARYDRFENDIGIELTISADAPRYKYGLVIAAACAIAATVVILFWKLLYRLFDGGDSGVEAKNRHSEFLGTDIDV